MSNREPRPNLSTDESYLVKTQDKVKGREGPPEYVHFEYLTEALKGLGVEADVYEGIAATRMPEEAKAAIDAAFEKLQANEPSPETVEKLHRLWDYLAESDPLEKADLIFVFGGISELAVREAIRLKKEGYAPKILFTGKHGSYMKDVPDLSEAEKYAKLAIEEGVDPNDILMEKDSINTVENVTNSAKLLAEQGLTPNSIITVSLPYHSKRANITLREAMGSEFKLIRHPGPSAKYTRDTYFKDKSGWSYICYEYLKIYMVWKGRHP